MNLSWFFVVFQVVAGIKNEENCEVVDSRGKSWEARPGQWAVSNCSSLDTNLGKYPLVYISHKN